MIFSCHWQIVLRFFGDVWCICGFNDPAWGLEISPSPLTVCCEHHMLGMFGVWSQKDLSRSLHASGVLAT